MNVEEIHGNDVWSYQFTRCWLGINVNITIMIIAISGGGGSRSRF